jgi:pimeloyl-ACP methyl ester carboxylesterase
MTGTTTAWESAVFNGVRAGAPHALVFAPVLPEWDGGAFFRPVIDTLTDGGYRVTVVDTLAALDDGVSSLSALAQRLRSLLIEHGPIDLLCGNALGGAVAQALLPDIHPDTGVLLVSAPSKSDSRLAGLLAEIADLADDGRLAESLDLLDRLVLPVGARRHAPRPLRLRDRPAAARRITTGLRLLSDVDVSAEVRGHPGPLLNLVGERSQLVGVRHTAAAAHHRVRVVPGCGMRPHVEQAELVSGIVKGFLREQCEGIVQ